MKTQSKKQIEFFRLISMPTLERIEKGLPETVKDMSPYLGISYPTLILWHARAKAMGISKIDQPDDIVPTPQTQDEREWETFMKQLTADAAQKGATAPTRTLYAQLKGKMPKTNIDIKIGLSADEIARRNIEATKQLEEGGFK